MDHTTHATTNVIESTTFTSSVPPSVPPSVPLSVPPSHVYGGLLDPPTSPTLYPLLPSSFLLHQPTRAGSHFPTSLLYNCPSLTTITTSQIPRRLRCPPQTVVITDALSLQGLGSLLLQLHDQAVLTVDVLCLSRVKTKVSSVCKNHNRPLPHAGITVFEAGKGWQNKDVRGEGCPPPLRFSVKGISII